MADIELSYKGKKIVIREQHPHAVVTVDGREFSCHHHHPPDEKGLAMWMCDEAYFMSPDLKELARHFADYGYMFDDPNRVRVDDSGAVIKTGPRPTPEPHPDPDHEHDHEHGPGPDAPAKRRGKGGR